MTSHGDVDPNPKTLFIYCRSSNCLCFVDDYPRPLTLARDTSEEVLLLAEPQISIKIPHQTFTPNQVLEPLSKSIDMVVQVKDDAFNAQVPDLISKGFGKGLRSVYLMYNFPRKETSANSN